MACGLGWGWLPLGVVILMALSILVTYTIAVLNGDVAALFPYISDAGSSLPESSIFALFLNTAACIASITLVFRYWIVMDLARSGEGNVVVARLAKVAVVCGVLASFGLSLVGNFQDDKIPIVHFFGAFLVFVLGGVYCFLDTAITYKLSQAPIKYNSIYIGHLRLALAILGVVALVITGVAGYYSSYQSRNATDAGDSDRLHWSESDPGYTSHLVSTFGEWFMALAFILYFVSYIGDFRKLGVNIDLYHLHHHSNGGPGSLAHASNSTGLANNGYSRDETATETTPLVS